LKVCVLGTGRIGLPTAALLATHGHRVIGVDTNEAIVRKINSGRIPFDELGLPELVERARKLGNLLAKSEVEEADVFVIAVPTPLEKKERRANLRYVEEAAEMIRPHLRRKNLVVLESTVPPGTSEKLLVPVLEKSGMSACRDFHVAFCPERAMPGNTLQEMVHNDRIVGGIDMQSAELAMSLYSSFVEGSLHSTDIRTAEFAKLIENTFRDVNIALANEYAKLADELGVDVWAAIGLANRHPRVRIHRPGPGVGGHCLTKDPWFLIEGSKGSRIVPLAREINDRMPRYVLGAVRKILRGVRNPAITVLGVAYKGGVDDTSETPALRFIELAEREGYRVTIHDPHVKVFEREILPLEDAIRDSDCIVLITDHLEFSQVDPKELSQLVRNRNLVDTGNVLDRGKWEREGFKVRVLGNGATWK